MDNTTRRGFLGFVPLGAATLLPAARALAAPEAVATGLDDACILTPQSEEGPYYIDPKLDRADITEGRPGVPLGFRLRVIEAGSCTAIAGARVDIWHCDARGLYSAFPGQGDSRNIDQSNRTFLRGTRLAGASGWTEFKTIYPGWYDGRATHIHFKVFLDQRTVLTGQTFFPDALNEFIYTNVPDYTGRPRQRMIMNVNDRIATDLDPACIAYCAVKEERERYVATLTVAVDRNAEVADAHHMPPPAPGTHPPGPAPEGSHGSPPRRAHVIKDRLAALVPGPKR
ncbi:MAG TPA: intradiol ring-cleavage dioxygenase [Bradyrhizobium sp.]|nr:intradiol ring-cleavage dioxygenase [Bradyrhizobium sp.]